MNAPPLIVGLGHPFRGDDGVGPYAVAALRADGVAARHVEDPLELVTLWADAPHVVVIDAVVTGDAPPGTIHRWDGFALNLPLSRSSSSHGFGLAEAVALGRNLALLPRALTILGVEAASLQPAAMLSSAAISAVQQIVTGLKRSDLCPRS